MASTIVGGGLEVWPRGLEVSTSVSSEWDITSEDRISHQ